MPRKLVYDVAVSADGYIAGPGGDMTGFLFEGDHVAAYQARLDAYDTVLMGRRTYEFGYQFGLTPGDRPYPAMGNYVFSTSLQLPAESAVKLVSHDPLEVIDGLKAGEGGDIYVCGGGEFAGWLAAQGRLDALVLKVNPVLLGSGTPLLNGLALPLRNTGSLAYASGVILAQYDIVAAQRRGG